MSLQEVLIRKGDAETPEEATALIKSMREEVYAGEDPEEVLWAYGLEPDYVFDLLT